MTRPLDTGVRGGVMRPPTRARPGGWDGACSDPALVDAVRATVDVRCPCGATQLHRLVYVHATADCRRCGRTFGIRALTYRSLDPMAPPTVVVTLGFVSTPRDRRRPDGSV